MSYRNSRRERSREREPSPSYNYRDRPRDDYRDSRRHNIDHDVPRSRHSVQINGLSSIVKSYEVENFLEKKVGGPLKTVYFKPDPRNNEAVIAVRFDDKEKAKICVETLHKTLMLGSKVFIDYYQDFNRHNEYIEKKQQIDDYRPSRGRSRDRSPIRTNRSPPPHHQNVSRSDEFYVRTPTPDYRNDRNKYINDDMDALSSRNDLPRRPPLLPRPPLSAPESSFSGFQREIHLNNLSSQHPAAPAPYPISGPLHSSNRSSNIPPPGFSSVLPISKEHTRFSKFSTTNFPEIKSSTVEPKVNSDQTWRTSDPDTFSAARLGTVQTLKYQQQKNKNDIQGLFRLGAVSVEASKNEMRKEKFLRLTTLARSKVEEKKHELLKAYQDDCNTYGFLTQSLINKNATLEESLRVALAEVLKDLEDGYKKTLDDYIDLFLTE